MRYYYIPQSIISQSTGSQEGVSQAFAQNTFAFNSPKTINPFIIDLPTFSIEGATYLYYDETTTRISSDINLGKQYTLIFTGNTSTLSGISTLNHELYKITYDSYTEALLDNSSSAFTETITESIQSPFITFIDSASTVNSEIAGNRYKVIFPIKIKQSNSYTINLFEDKAQYFINPIFTFNKPNDLTIGAIQTITGSSEDQSVIQILDYYRDQYTLTKSSSLTHTISGNTPFSGLTVRGAYFCYIIPPKKPNLKVSDGNKQISVQGLQPTFSPQFNFNNVEDGDYYRLQVTYDNNDYTFQSPTVANFYINRMFKGRIDSDTVVTYSTPLTPNKKFLYRIGNTRELNDLFGVKQALTTWSDIINAETANDGKFTLSGTCYVNNVSGATLSGVTIELIGVYSNSSVDILVDSPRSKTVAREITTAIDKNNLSTSSSQSTTIATTTSDQNGVYNFGRIDGGTYLLRVTPPIDFNDVYNVTTQQITILGDTNIDVFLGIVWGNNIINFTYPATFL